MYARNFFLVTALALLSACSSPVTTEPSSASPAVDTPDVSSATNETFVIDVRSQDEWDTGHVEQAVNIPHTEIGARIGEVTQNKAAKLIVYCKAGGRANAAKKTLEGMGFTNVENAGGFDDIKNRYSIAE